MDALFKRTGTAEFPRHMKILVSGPPKAGKTSFLATAPNIVIADTEPQAQGLQSIAHKNVPYVTVDHSDRLQQLLFVLRDDSMRAKAAEQMGMPKIETVAVDTTDGLQVLLKKERLRSERRTQFMRDDWGWLKDQMIEIIQAFTSLPLNVIFTVHTKTQEISEGNNVILPGLQGAIAEEIAGMFGYSVLAHRSREVRPDGVPYTRYFLRVEGDDHNPHLGNRAAGRLPDVVDPDFTILQKTVFEGLQLSQPAAPVAIQTAEPTPVTTAPLSSSTPNVVPQPQAPAQNPGQPAQAAQAAPAAQVGAPPNDENAPINATALQHLAKTYGEVGVPWNEDMAKGWTLGHARTIVRMWSAMKADATKDQTGDPRPAMIEFLGTLESLPQGFSATGASSPAPTQDQPQPPLPPEAQPQQQTVAQETQPNPDGTIAEVMMYVGGNLALAQEVLEKENAKPKPRATLVNALVNMGARPPAPVVPEVQTPVETPAPATPESVVTSGPAPTDNASTVEPPAAASAATEEQAVAAVKETLGGEVVDSQPTATAEIPEEQRPCEECGKTVDDLDIARLSKARFERWLCVSDYIAQTKKPKEAAAS